jgi:hypothetical protein
MIAAHHLVVVVICNTATPLLKAKDNAKNNIKIKT